MLESILLRTLYTLRTVTNQRNFVFLDSVNALAIYNDDRMLAGTYTFINTFRQREVLSCCSTFQTKLRRWFWPISTPIARI